MPVPTFSVCAKSFEHPKIIERFATFHANAGAERILIVHDGHASDLWDQGLTLPPDVAAKTEIIGAEDEIWIKPEYIRDARFYRRQETVIRYCHDLNESDWLFCIDADEYLFAQRPIGEILKSIPEDVDSIRFENVEAVWGPGEDLAKEFGSSYFRRRMPPSNETDKKLKATYGHATRLFNEHGLVGYFEGKSAHRRSADVDLITAHWAERNGEIASQWATKFLNSSEELLILHFDAISLRRWRSKFDRRKSVPIGNKRRRILTRVVNIADRLGYGPKLFRYLYGLSSAQLESLGPEFVLKLDFLEQSNSKAGQR